MGCWVQLGWKRKLPINPRSNAGIFNGDKKSPALERSCLNQALNSPASFALASAPHCHPSEPSPTARIFQTTAAGFRSAGFQTCCVADFQVGKTNGSRTGSGFGNPQHSRLGSPRYFGGSCAAPRYGEASR
jgi:hypothetical protein